MGFIDTRMTPTRLQTAKLHVYNVCSTGQDLTFIGVGTKDEMGSVTVESNITFKTHPVRFSPFEREVAQRISWIEDVDVVFYISKYAVDSASTDIDKIKRKYKKVRYKRKDYDIKYVDLFSAFGTDHLYIIVGAKK